MNHIRLFIVSLTEGQTMESCRSSSVIVAGSNSVKIVCRSADRRSTVGAAASFGVDGIDVMGVTR